MKKFFNILLLYTIGLLAKTARLLFNREKSKVKRMRMFDVAEPSVRLLGDCLLKHQVIDGVMTYTLAPPLKSNNRKIIYLHGGAFISGPVRFHWQMLGRMCELSGSEILVVLYRKSPENIYPAQMNDLMSVYDHLRRTIDPSDIVFMGDSAGGGAARGSGTDCASAVPPPATPAPGHGGKGQTAPVQ
ncbi:MAG: alpha/beta hydrolase [Bacteroidales bacterium]